MKRAYGTYRRSLNKWVTPNTTVSEREEKEARSLFKEIMAGNSQNLQREIDTQIHKTQKDTKWSPPSTETHHN